MQYSIALSLTERVGSVTMRQLLERFGAAEAVMKAGLDRLLAEGVSPFVARKISEQTLDRAKSIIEQCERQGVRILVYGMPGYPEAFAECADAPSVIYVRGAVDFNEGKWVSVVGTRYASPTGLSTCDRVVRELAFTFPDLVVVSGLALGIDKAAHQAALKYQVKTVAVMAGWVDDIVPRSHYHLARRILDAGGAIVSEQPPGAVIEKSSFLQRNRLIAGLSPVTIVVESAIRGGSLTTADIALSYHKELFALPGSIQESSMAGTNMLIRSNKAVMYQSAEDVAQVLGWERSKRREVPMLEDVDLPEHLKQAYERLEPTGKYDIESLCQLWELEHTWEASSVVNQLRVKGLIKVDPYRCYYKG